jgi:CheY-like chemotaxis protein
MKLEQASVLFVEDEPFLRETMGAWLEQKAARVFCAEHGAAALVILAGNKIDLVLTDVRMPVMDGIALVKKLGQASMHLPHVILITGFSDLSLREAYELGVDAVVEKPINREELLAAMQRSLAGPDELWRQPRNAEPILQLKVSFPSLAAALKEKRIAFGRRGFCIKTASLPEGPVAFAVNFKADQRIVSGQGVVRWFAPQENQAGIEITHVDDVGRAWVIDLVERSRPVSFIPGSTSRQPAARLKAA